MTRIPGTLALAAVLSLCACDRPELGCAETGGTVVTGQCCPSVGDLPNTCASGACGCAPADSVARSVCQCPTGRCFDGTACVSR